MGKDNAERARIALTALRTRHVALAAEVATAQTDADRAYAALLAFLVDGDISDTRQRARLEAAVMAADPRPAVLKRSLETVAQRIARCERTLSGGGETAVERRERGRQIAMRAKGQGDAAGRSAAHERGRQIALKAQGKVQ